jgi:MYXO-CTERM domain-containing protein
MIRFDALKWPLAAVLLCTATMAGAERAPTRLAAAERRAEPVSAPVSADSGGGPAVSGLVESKDGPKRPEWLMLLAGLAVAGWIAQRRMASPLE